MVDKAGLPELERPRQAGPLFLSRGKEGAIEVVDDGPDEFGALMKKWQQRLTLETINICKAYIDGKINIVLVGVAPDGKKYGLIIRRAPDGKINPMLPVGPALRTLGPPEVAAWPIGIRE